MADYKGATGRLGSWEETYRGMPAEELPWNAGEADKDLLALLASGRVPRGKAYELGCGPGNDAAELARQGWKVTAVDIAPAAVRLARATARRRGVTGRISFKVGDVLALRGKADAALVHDRGCFHTLPSKLWGDYRRTAAGLLDAGGILALKVFSHRAAAGRGPYRFKPEEVLKVFSDGFEAVSIKNGFFHGPARPHALFCVFRRAL